jgi:hypothetical protein
MMALRDSLRSGDIWVEGSRTFRAFGDFLLPPEAFVVRRQQGELGLAVPDRFEDWRTERTALLESRLPEIESLASAGNLSRPLLPQRVCRSTPFVKTKIMNQTMSRGGSTACRHACGSPSFTPKSMVGQDLPNASVIFERARRLMKISG